MSDFKAASIFASFKTKRFFSLDQKNNEATFVQKRKKR